MIKAADLPSTAPDVGLSTSLDHPETTAPEETSAFCTTYAPVELNSATIHSGWTRDRERVRRAFWEAGVTEARQWRFATCAGQAIVLRSKLDPNLYKLTPARCHDRFCRPCQLVRTTAVQQKLATAIAERTCRLITLTLKAEQTTLTARLNRLYAAFKRLRATDLWKSNVEGAIAVTEMKRNLATRCWHVHLHVVTTGKYIHQKTLSLLWQALTGDSTIVDIRLIRGACHAANYLAKYLQKNTDHETFCDPPSLSELVTATKGRRLLICTGCWKNLKLTEPPTEEEWEYLGPLANVMFFPSLTPWQMDALQILAEQWRTDPNRDTIRFDAEYSDQPAAPPVTHPL